MKKLRQRCHLPLYLDGTLYSEWRWLIVGQSHEYLEHPRNKGQVSERSAQTNQVAVCYIYERGFSSEADAFYQEGSGKKK